MEINTLKEIISGLAKGQGFYGRLKESLDNENNWEMLKDYCDNNNINDVVDLVMVLEC